MPTPATMIAIQVRPGIFCPMKIRAINAVSSGPIAMVTSTLATLVSVMAIM